VIDLGTAIAQAGFQDAPGVARRWRVINARPVKYTSAPLDGSGGADVAMEELVLGYDAFARSIRAQAERPWLDDARERGIQSC